MNVRIRVELIVDGIVHYDKIHTPDEVDKKIETLKNYIQRKHYYLCNYELSKYILSKHTTAGVSKLSVKDKERALQLMNIYDAKVVAKRYNVNYQTLYRYKRQSQLP